jgi:diguanylate cyclase (GGDEF)-like protein
VSALRFPNGLRRGSSRDGRRVAAPSPTGGHQEQEAHQAEGSARDDPRGSGVATRDGHDDCSLNRLDYSVFGPSVTPSMKLAGVTNCVWVPMIRDGDVFAILAVAGRQNGLVRPATLEHLKAVAAMGVLALANAELHETVGNLARTDPLTGTANRRALSERISQLPRVPFAFVAIDVDGLKPVNDTHGHSAGDELLAAIATRMQTELRSADVLARTGGDEFVVLMVGSDAEGATELAGRLKQAVSSLALFWGTPSISVGSAVGAAGADPARVAEKADEALYAAKQSRRKSGALGVPILG